MLGLGLGSGIELTLVSGVGSGIGIVAVAGIGSGLSLISKCQQEFKICVKAMLGLGDRV